MKKGCVVKFFKYGLLCGLLFTQCFGMARKPLNPAVENILEQLRTKNLAGTLQADEFWQFMAASTDMGSCFLGEALGQICDSDVCFILTKLAQFGTQDQNKFYECMSGCTGSDGITPLKELIRLMPVNPQEKPLLCMLFFGLLNLIEKLEKEQRFAILSQKEMYKPEEGPLDVARTSGKGYVATRIHDLLYKDANVSWSPDGRFIVTVNEIYKF